MQVWLGIGFAIAGLLALGQSYQTVQYALWLKGKNGIRLKALLLERAHHWYRRQVLEAVWWVLSGLSGILFGLWLLVLSFH